MRKFSVLAVGIIVTACTQHPKVAAMVQPATFIESRDLEAVTNKIAELCDRRGMQIDETTKNAVTCSQIGSFDAQFWNSTKYGTDVRLRIRFNAFLVGKESVKIAGNTWYESETAYGQTRRNNSANTANKALMQSIMNETKAEIEGDSP